MNSLKTPDGRHTRRNIYRLYQGGFGGCCFSEGERIESEDEKNQKRVQVFVGKVFEHE